MNEGSSFIAFYENISNKFFRLRDKYKNHYLLKRFSFEEIVIIASLLEKEGVDLEPIKRSSEKFLQMWEWFLENKGTFK